MTDLAAINRLWQSPCWHCAADWCTLNFTLLVEFGLTSDVHAQWCCFSDSVGRATSGGGCLQVRGIVRAIGKQTNSQILSQVPVMTAELPGTYTSELANAVDVIGANIQPFYMGDTDASRHKK